MKFRLSFAAQILKNGGVISHPSDTIQSVGCLPDFPIAIEKLISLKRRSISKGLILLTSDIAYVLHYIDIELLSENALEQLFKINPNPTTYLLPASPNTPTYLTGGKGTIAVRLTSNKLVKYLCDNTESSLVSTSANVSSLQPASSTLKLRVYFGDKLDLILHPSSNNTRASKIINLLSGERYR
tara:strand:+ start:4397 stop:4948 length:552 start_codon:yes stop_codon:yes gene_type:complete